MKRIFSIVCILSLFLLFGCIESETQEDGSIETGGLEGYVNLRAGAVVADDCKVLCVAYVGGYGGGLSCDWNNKICEGD